MVQDTSIEMTANLAGAAVLGAMADPVVVVGPDSSLLWANRAAEERFGWRLDDRVGEPMLPLIHPDDLDTAALSLGSVREKEVGTLVSIRIRDDAGGYSWFEVRGRACPTEAEPEAVVLNLRETTWRGEWQVSGGDPLLLSRVIDAAPAVILLLDREGCVRGANRALTRLLGRSLESTVGGRLDELAHPGDRALVRATIGAAAQTSDRVSFEARFARRDGGAVPLGLTVVNLLDDRVVGSIVVSGADISPLVAARAELEHLATHDGLTGLANRTQLRSRLEEILRGPAAATHRLLFADVDGLKAVNDRFGHRAGDAALAAVADRLRAVTRSDVDLVARLGGDEFVIVVGAAEGQVLPDLEARIADAMATPVTLPDGHRVPMSVSVGAAGFADGVDVDELLAAADAAMYVAKRSLAAS